MFIEFRRLLVSREMRLPLWTKVRFASLLLGIAGSAPASAAVARDLDALTRLLVPADLALMVSNACTATDPSFSHDLGGPRGTVPEYAQRVKDAVSDSLTPEQVQIVLHQAADVARAAALRALRAAAAPDDAEEEARMHEWCATAVKPFVQAFVRAQDENIEDFTRQLKHAK